MSLFKKKDESESLDYSAINEFAESGRKVNKLLQILIILGIVGMGVMLLQKIHVLPILLDFLGVISPIFLGLIIAWIACPFTDKLDKKMPRIVACLIVYLIILGILALILIYTVPSLVNQIKTLSGKIPSMIDDLQNFFNRLADKLNVSNSGFFQSIKKSLFDGLKNIDGTSFANAIIGGATSVVNVLTTLFLSLMVGFYFLLDFHKLSAKFHKYLPAKYQKDAKVLSVKINQSLRGYIQGVLIVMVLVFATQTIGLTLAGHEAPMLFALFCAITDVIPFFGPWIGGIPAVVVGFLISPLTGVLTIVSILIVQALENNIYQPIIMGHAMKLHPVTIIASLLIFGHFFGIIGMIVATPVVATLKLLFEFVDQKLRFMRKLENL